MQIKINIIMPITTIEFGTAFLIIKPLNNNNI